MDETLESISSIRRWQWPRTAPTLLFALMVLGLAACGPKSEAPPTPAAHLPASESRGPLALTTEQLARAYREDEAAAQVKYGRRQLHVTGIVQQVMLDNINAPELQLSHNVLVILNSKPAAATSNVGAIITVVCEDVSSKASVPSLLNCVVKPPLNFGT